MSLQALTMAATPTSCGQIRTLWTFFPRPGSGSIRSARSNRRESEMQFVLPGPMPNPAAAEDVMSSLWGTSQTFASRISLWIVGWGDGKVHVAVAASVPKAESIAVETIGLGAAPGESGAVSGDAVIASALASGDCYCIAVVPPDRGISGNHTSD